jgi:hypothetical protein
MIRILLASAAFIAAPAIAQEAAPAAQTVLGPKITNSAAIDTVTGPANYRYPKKYDGYVLRDYTVTSSSFGVRNNDGSEITIDRGSWRDTGSPEKIGAVFALGGSGSLNLRNVTAAGNYDPKKKVKTEFPNRDVVMGAQRTFLTIENSTLNNAWDASMDTKADTRLIGTVVCQGSRVCLKAWYKVEADTLVSIGARDGDVSCLQSPVVLCSVHIRKLIVRNDNPNGLLVGFQGPGTVRIDECELHVPASYRVTWAKAKVTGQKLILGPGCAKDGKIVVAPEKPVAGPPAAQIVDAGQLLADGLKDGLITLGPKWAKKLGLKTNTVVRHLDGFRYQVVR